MRGAFNQGGSCKVRMSSTSDQPPQREAADTDSEVGTDGAPRLEVGRTPSLVRRFGLLSLGTAIAVLVVGVATSLGAAAYLRVDLVSNASNRFVSSASNTNSAMTSTLRRYGDLSATTAAFIGTNLTTDYLRNRAAFLGYVQSIGLAERYPGTYGLGFVGRVPAADAS